jgi:hypothetical protein
LEESGDAAWPEREQARLHVFIFCSTNWEDLIVKHRKWTCLDYLRFTFSFDQNDLSIVRKHNVVFLNMHKYCNASNSYDRLETVRLSSVLSFGALMISEPVNEVDTEIFKVGNETKDLLRAAFSIGGSPKGVG